MVKKSVSIIIPNYNGAKLLVNNLPKVLAAANKYSTDTEIIVVDDCSTDDSLEVLKQFSRVKVLAQETNEGFSSSCNLGVKQAAGEIIVLLNTDIRPEIDFLLFLVPHFNNQEVFAVGCLDKSLENGQEVNRGRGIGWFKSGFLVHARGEINKYNTLWASGGSSAFDKKKWNELGGFDQVFNPFYWEDIDLSYRAQKRGYKVLFEPKTIVYHQHEEGAIKSKFNDRKIKTVAYRNQFLFVWKNITDTDLLWQHLYYLPVHFIKALVRKDWPFIIGFFQAIIILPRLNKYRHNTNLVQDREILAPYLNEN